MLAAGMLGGLVVYLKKSHPFPRTYSLSVVFPNAQGVEAGAPVNMAGVSIGTVDQVTLEGQQANVVLHIQEETKIARGSRFIASPLLVSIPASIAILPPTVTSANTSDILAPEEAHLMGESGPNITDVVAKAAPLLSELTQVSRKTSTLLKETTDTVQGVNAIVGNRQTQRELRETVARLHEMAGDGAKLMPELSLAIRQTQARSKTLLGNLTDTSSDLKALTRNSRPKAATILSNVEETSATASRLAKNGDALVQQGKELLQQGDKLLKNEEVGKKLSNTFDTFSETLANLKALSEKMNGIASSTQTLVGDPEMARNLKEFVRNMQAVSENLNGFATTAQPLLNDPSTVSDLKETLHNVKELTTVAKTLLELLTKAAGKK